LNCYSVQLTEAEIKVAIQLFDCAVRAQGLQVAEAALVLSRKMEAAMKSREVADPKPTLKPDGANGVVMASGT